MDIILKEVHYLNSGQTFYEFDKENKCEYEIVLVEGYKSDRKHTFIQNTDYELLNNGLRWLSGDLPEAPPSFISTSGKIPFEITYLYEDSPVDAAERSVFPFMKTNGIYLTVLRSLTSEIVRIFSVNNGIITAHDMTKSSGNDLDHLASWFDITRFSGENDFMLRGRLSEFLESYVSSGTLDSVSAAIEAYTGTVPTISELWKTVSYFDYNQDDYDAGLPPDQWRVYLFEGGSPEGYEFQAYFWDELYQLNTFLCILPDNVIIQYGVSNIKVILNKAKAAGVQAYLGWLVDEDFATAVVGTPEADVDWLVVAP